VRVGSAAAIEVQADYALRGPDFETLLVGPVTGTIIDADRVVRAEWRNGFPNWAMYRCALAGDTHLRTRLRQWCVSFAIAYVMEGAVARKTASDELATLAGWDAYAALLTTRWALSADEVASSLGVNPKTYRKLRNAVYARLRASLDEYWVRMQIAMRQVALVERTHTQATPMGRLSDGRGFGEIDPAGDGCFRAMPRGSGS
jgi:hypothetical protein